MTLVEVLVSAVLLSVGVAGMMSAASLSMRNQRQSELRSIGLALAQEKMTEIELLGPSGWTAARPGQGTEDRDGLAYSWSGRVEQLGAMGPLFQVTVQVNWSGPGAGEIELQTLLNDYGELSTESTGQKDEAKPQDGAPR